MVRRLAVAVDVGEGSGEGREEEVVVVLDVLEFVGDDDGTAGLAVFEGC